MNTALALTNISKSYKLYAKNSDRLLEALNPFGKKRGTDFFALRDINFSLSKGESLGIIGENGSGKSTLLKIISGVLAPSSGEILRQGSMGCLLELGGGFNGELSGLENARIQMLLNGASADEATLEAIVEFADIGDFIRHPVKKYSSGMFMRLAFACATVVNPEILIVDEALAVGDIFFVKKCMNRMHQLLASGTTLLFVSHDIEAVRRLCAKALWLGGGEQMDFGPAGPVAERYAAYIWKKGAQSGNCEESEEADSPNARRPRDMLAPALHMVEGNIDLTEQRLFVSGAWQWRHDAAKSLGMRYAKGCEATAAFRARGDLLTLSFLRGGGFALPEVCVDGEKIPLKIDNDGPFWDVTRAPAQVYNQSIHLPEGEHIVTIRPDKGPGNGPDNGPDNRPVAWLGGGCSRNGPDLMYRENAERIHALETNCFCHGDKKAVISEVELLDAATLAPVERVSLFQPVVLRICAKRSGVMDGEVSIAYKIKNRLSVTMFGTSTREEMHILDANASKWIAEFAFTMPVKSGVYTVSAAVVSKKNGQYAVHHFIDVAATISVQAEKDRAVWGEFYNPSGIRVRQLY